MFFNGGARSSPRARRGCCSWSSWGKSVKAWLAMLLVVVTVLGGSQGPMMQLARFVGAATELGVATSQATSSALNLTGALAQSATSVVSSATSNGLSAADNAWRGVDVLDLHTHRCAGLLTVDGREFLEAWFQRPAALQLVPCLTTMLEEALLAAVETVAVSMPMAQTAQEGLVLGLNFSSMKIWAQLLPNGKTQVHYDVVELSYRLEWSNPIWGTLGVPVTSEREQVLRSLRRTILELPSPNPREQQHLEALAVDVSWPLLRAKARSWARGWLCRVANWWQPDVLNTWRGEGAVEWRPCSFSFPCGTLLSWILTLCFAILVSLRNKLSFFAVFPPRQHVEILLAVKDGDTMMAAHPSPEVVPVEDSEAESGVQLVSCKGVVEDTQEDSDKSSLSSFCAVSAISRVSSDFSSGSYEHVSVDF